MTERTSKKQFPQCPTCGGDRIYRSRRRGLAEWTLHYFFLKSPYRCQACSERFFRSRFARPNKKELQHHPA